MTRIKLLIGLLFMLILALSGCRDDDLNQKDEVLEVTESSFSESEEEITATDMLTEDDAVSEKIEDTAQREEEDSKDSTDTDSVSAATEIPKINDTETSDKIENAEPPSEQPKPETTPSQSQQPTTPNEPVETENEPAVETAPKATEADCKEIAKKIIEYINSYRETPAISLPGLTVYAEYRSRQLVSNFAHDTDDERAAATALCYGEYVDPDLYGMTGEPYYTAGAREAIAKAGYAGSVDYVAESLALLVKNSSGHWAYVGSSDYPYIAVGVTYESGMWYCDIAMAVENTDNY